MGEILFLGDGPHGTPVYDLVYKELDLFKPNIITVEANIKELSHYVNLLFNSKIDGKKVVRLMHNGFFPDMFNTCWTVIAAATYARDNSIPCYPIDLSFFKKDEKPKRIPLSFEIKNRDYFFAVNLMNCAYEFMRYLPLTSEYIEKKEKFRTTPEGMQKRNYYSGALINMIMKFYSTKYGEDINLAHGGGSEHFRCGIKDKRFEKLLGIEDCIEDYIKEYPFRVKIFCSMGGHFSSREDIMLFEFSSTKGITKVPDRYHNMLT